MTNHWTRFFPLVKHIRRAFLRSKDKSTLYESDGKLVIESSQPETTQQQQQNHEYSLGKVLAMKGDFSFPTPIDPSDRFLNRTLGGGSILDVGCYLVELALLAAYEHEQSHHLPMHERKRRLKPDGIVATGHGVYRGATYPVDVESSFSLRWGGGPGGIIAGCEGVSGVTTDERRCETTSIGGKTFVQNKLETTSNAFTMLGTFQTSFRRPSEFEVEYTFERGRILIHGPANCPSEMTIYENDGAFGPLIRQTKVTFPLPQIKQELLRYGRPNYPRAEGFVYVIDAIEKCMAEKGIPGKVESRGGCLELEENTIEEQLVTVGKFLYCNCYSVTFH